MMFLRFDSIAVLSLFGVTTAFDILVIGDSWAAKSQQYLQADCSGGKTVKNLGVDASLAANWAAGACPQIPGAQCSVPAAVSAAAPPGTPMPQFVWLSVGGNDYVGAACLNALQLPIVIGGAMKAVRLALPQAKILMTGYCTPPSTARAFVPATCQAATAIGPLNDAIQKVCTPQANCIYVDSTSACGGSRSTFSDPSLFANPMHLNAAGYQKLFGQPGVQQALGCAVAPPSAKFIAGNDYFPKGFSSQGLALTCAALGVAFVTFAFAISRFRSRRVSEACVMQRVSLHEGEELE